MGLILPAWEEKVGRGSAGRAVGREQLAYWSIGSCCTTLMEAYC